MCTIDDWNKEEKMMQDSLFKKIANELSENKQYLKRVNLYRDGEPSIENCLKELNILRSLIFQMSQYLLMLVCLQSKKHEKFCAGMNMVTLSIDSLNKEVYESIRRGLIFEKCIENAKIL